MEILVHLTDQVNETVESGMRQIVEGICRVQGVSAEVSYDTFFRPVINTKVKLNAACEASAEMEGSEEYGDSEVQPSSEDFAHLAVERPVYFLLKGNGIKG